MKLHAALLVVSTDSVENNRAMGLRSPVVLAGGCGAAIVSDGYAIFIDGHPAQV
jgi:hypothetical protein